MAVDAIRYGSRGRRPDTRAAKEKRQKIFLAVGGLVLVLLLAWQGPKTLKALRGSSAADTAAPAPTTPGAVPAAPAAPKPVRLRQFDRYPGKDPFVPLVTAGPLAAATPVATATPPAVRLSHFVAKDPFVQQVTLTDVPAAPPAKGGKGGSASGRLSYIVMVASIPLGDGHRKADQAAALARKRGVGSVHIVDSSDYGTLRSGFYAVYSGPYETLDATLAALERVRGRGYVSAYTRRIEP